MTSQAGRLDQIVFRWSAQSQIGHGGAGPAAASLLGAELQRWDELLSLRITRSSDGNTAPSLAYLRFGPESVVVHKVPARDDKGRRGAAIAHALIGPSEVVDVELALGLDGWPGWAGDSHPTGQLPGLDPAELAGGISETLRRLREVELGQDFEQVLAYAMDNPAGSFTVVQRDAAATALVLGLVDVLGTVPGNEWTFATNEDTDTGPDLPRLVFLDTVPGNIGYAVTRQRLHLGADGSRPDPFALALADLRLERGARAVAEVRRDRRLASHADVQRWRSETFVAGTILTGELLDTVTSGVADRSCRALLRTSDGYDAAERELRSYSDGKLRTIFEAWAPGSVLAHEFPDVALLVQTRALWRCLTRSTTSQALFTSVQRSAVGVDAIDEQLELWASDRPRKVPLTTARVVEVLQRALALGLPPNVRQDGLRAVLDHLPLAQLLIQANTFTLINPELAQLLLLAAETRQHDESERDNAREALESAEYLMHCIPVLVADAQVAANLWHQVLLAVYGRELGTDRNRMRRILDLLARDAATEVPPAFVYALRSLVTDPAARAMVDQLAARDRYLAAGLPDIWPERQRAPVAAPVPVPAVVTGVARAVGSVSSRAHDIVRRSTEPTSSPRRIREDTIREDTIREDTQATQRLPVPAGGPKATSRTKAKPSQHAKPSQRATAGQHATARREASRSRWSRSRWSLLTKESIVIAVGLVLIAIIAVIAIVAGMRLP